jgi:hypothetical protein
MINYAQILYINYVDKQYILNGDSYEGLDWLDPSPKPTQAELDALAPSTDEKVAKNTCKQQASELLYATDWTTIPDVANPSDSNPYLINQREFMTWRSEIRALAVNPVVDPVWPTQPTPQWGNKA